MTRWAVVLFVVALLAAPLAAEAQPEGRVRRIGWLAAGSPTAAIPNAIVEGFRRGLQEHGYAEGQNLIIERRYAEWRLDRLPSLAAELAAMNVDAIVVVGPAGILAARQATRTIPIVMVASSNDPVGEGLVASLARPGGNITGLTAAVSSEIMGKQLELLRETLGSTTRMGVLWDLRAGLLHQSWKQALDEAARRLQVKTDTVEVAVPEDFERAFTVFSHQRVETVYVTMAGATYVHRARVAELAARYRLPTVAYFRELPETGGLMSYGPNILETYRRGAWYVVRILKGAKPADLPVEQPTKFELVINLKTAKALGLTIPQSVLLQADEVIQ